jgi:hypothetical protein
VFNKSIPKLILFVFFAINNSLFSQLQIGDISPNFSAPICANSNEITFDLYQNTNGAVNGGNFKVIWLNLFTSW